MKHCLKEKGEPSYAQSLYRPNTLCEVCKKALGKCTWSKYGVQQPIDGWTAIRRDLPSCTSGAKQESYIVLDCPEFVVEEVNAWAYKRFDPEAIKKKYEEDNTNE